MTNSSNSHYLEGLTWLRAIAALLVVFSHVIRAAEGNYLNDQSINVPTIFYWFDLGTFGVLLFFTLSGTTLYISSLNKSNRIISFFIKRFFRIWPAFACSLLVYALFRPVFTEFYIGDMSNWVVGQYIIEYGVVELISYLTLTSNFFVQAGIFNNAFWSLPVEFQYYLCFPLLVWLVNRLGVIGPFFFGLFLYSIYKFRLIEMPDTKVFMLGFSFCFGVIIGYLYEKKPSILRVPFSGLSLFLTFLVAATITIFPDYLPDIPVLSGIWNCYIILASIAVVIVLFNEPKLPKIIKPLFMQLGEISYSLYLWHNLIITAILLTLIQLGLLTDQWVFYLLLTSTLFINYLVSILSYRFVEKPGIKFGRKLEKSVKDD